MEKNQYIPVMIQSLKKKSEILDAIMELNIRQSEELFDRVKDDLKNHQDLYRDEIAQMQDYIRKLTSKSATIQVQEARNKDLMTKKFASVHKQVREVRKSQRVVNQYYKNMMKTNYGEPVFTDKKK